MYQGGTQDPSLTWSLCMEGSFSTAITWIWYGNVLVKSYWYRSLKITVLVQYDCITCQRSTWHCRWLYTLNTGKGIFFAYLFKEPCKYSSTCVAWLLQITYPKLESHLNSKRSHSRVYWRRTGWSLKDELWKVNKTKAFSSKRIKVLLHDAGLPSPLHYFTKQFIRLHSETITKTQHWKIIFLYCHLSYIFQGTHLHNIPDRHYCWLY